MKCFFCDSEASYSKAIAQTFTISKDFRKRLTDLINSKHDNYQIKTMSSDEIRSAVVENSFDGNNDRIDILFELK